MLTSNEEGDAKDGTIEKVLDDLKQNNNAINYCLAGEPSSKNELGDTVRIGRRGSLSGKLKVIGKQGHIAYPEKIINPIFLIGRKTADLVPITMIGSVALIIFCQTTLLCLAEQLL